MGLIKSLKKKSEKRRFNNSIKDFPQKLKNNNLKGLFIDCGANLGQGYSFFSAYFTPELYDVIMIEPNPNCMAIVKEKFSELPIEFIEAAAWIEKTQLEFFGLNEDDRGSTSDGGSVIESHNNLFYEANKEKSVTVNAISFSDLVLEKSKVYDQIIVKMDIESAEYEVLKDLLNSGAVLKINHIYVEFHHQYFKEEDQSKYKKLEKQLVKKLKNKGVGVSLWH